MKFYMCLMTLLIWIPVCSAQDVDMTKVCEEAANSSGLDATGAANLRATCVQAAACSASCNRIINNGDAFTACIQKCILPDGDAPQIKPSAEDSDTKKDTKDTKGDKGDLCTQAADFRDHQLFHLWDTEQKKYAIFTEGSDSQVKLRDQTAKLMDAEWWAGSTGGEVAIEIKGYTDIVNDAIGVFVPEAEVVQIGTSVIHHAREIADGVTSIAILVTYSKENADAAAKQVGTEIVAKYGRQMGSVTKVLLDTAEYAKTKDNAERYRETVQAQVRRINETLRTLDDKRKAAIEKMDAYQEIVSGIDMLCANKKQTPRDDTASVPAPSPH